MKDRLQQILRYQDFATFFTIFFTYVLQQKEHNNDDFMLSRRVGLHPAIVALHPAAVAYHPAAVAHHPSVAALLPAAAALHPAAVAHMPAV
jgi:hypothetical protein